MCDRPLLRRLLRRRYGDRSRMGRVLHGGERWGRAWMLMSSWICFTVPIRWRWSSIDWRMKSEVRDASWSSGILIVLFWWLVDWLTASSRADKDRELSEAQAEIKALRLSERLREKAVEEVLILFHCLYLRNWIMHWRANLDLSYLVTLLWVHGSLWTYK